MNFRHSAQPEAQNIFPVICIPLLLCFFALNTPYQIPLGNHYLVGGQAHINVMRKTNMILAGDAPSKFHSKLQYLLLQ